jgi:hypothetical protein
MVVQISNPLWSESGWSGANSSTSVDSSEARAKPGYMGYDAAQQILNLDFFKGFYGTSKPIKSGFHQ